MMINIRCPKCGKMLRVQDSAGGQKLPCAKCGQRLKVPIPVEMQTMDADLVLPKNLVPKVVTVAVKAPAKPPKSGGMGQFLEGLGALIFAGLAGLAMLLFIGFLIWKGIKRTETATVREVAGVTHSEKEKDRPLEPKEIFERCSASVAQVLHHRAVGSGFLARPGLVVTNGHVVVGDFSNHIQVTFPSAPGGNNPVNATLLHLDRKRDLAILRIDSTLQPLPIADRECSPGEPVVVIGSPAMRPGKTVQNALTAGNWSAKTQLDDNQDWYQFTAASNPGNSGGPIFNSRGQVIGVVTLGLIGKQGMNYGVPYPDVIKALNRAQAKQQKELDEVAAEHDLAEAFHRIGKSAHLYLIAMNEYYRHMNEAVKRGEHPKEGIVRAEKSIDQGINRGAGSYYDRECHEALPQILKRSKRSLDKEISQRFEELITLRLEIKQWYDQPQPNVDIYGRKTAECHAKLKKLFETLQLNLGVDEPWVTRSELQSFGL